MEDELMEQFVSIIQTSVNKKSSYIEGNNFIFKQGIRKLKSGLKRMKVV
jgi:hypothetical protein